MKSKQKVWKEIYENLLIKKINKKKSEVKKQKRVERSSDDPSSSIKRGEIPVCSSQQIKSDSCWTTCVYLNIIGRSLLFCFIILS